MAQTTTPTPSAQDYNKTTPPKGSTYDPGAALLGGANALTLGGLGSLYQLISGKKDFGLESPTAQEAYKSGNKAGEIGSYFLPMGAIAKGAVKGGQALAKGLEGAITASKYGKGAVEGLKAADALKAAGGPSQVDKVLNYLAGSSGKKGIVQSATRSGLDSAAQAAIRNATGYTDEFDPTGERGVGNVMGQLGSGALGGGIGGALGKLLGKTKNLSRGLENVGEDMERDWIANRFGVNTKAFRAGLQKATGASEKQVDKMMVDMGTTLRKYGVNTKNDARGLLENVGKTFDNAGEAYSKAGIKPSELLEKIKQQPEVVRFIKTYGQAGEAKLNDMLKQLDNLESYADQRALLNEYFEAARRTGLSGKQGPMLSSTGNVTTDIKQVIDDTAWDALRSQGGDVINGLDIAAAKEIWGKLTPIRKALAMDALKPESLGIGSDTASKLAMFGLIPGGAPAAAGAAIIGNAAVKGINKLGNTAAGYAKQALAPIVRGAAENPIVQKIADSPLVEKAAGTGAGIGRAINAAESANKMDLEPTQAEKELAPMETLPGQEAKDTAPGEPVPGAMRLLDNGIKRKFNLRTKGYYGLADDSNPLYQKYKAQAMDILTRDTGDVDWYRASKAMFVDPDQAANFINALDTKSIMAKNMPSIGPAIGGNVFGIPAPGAGAAIASLPSFLGGNSEAMGSRDRIIELIKQLGGDAASKEAIKVMDKANSKAGLTEKLTDILNKSIARGPLGGQNYGK